MASTFDLDINVVRLDSRPFALSVSFLGAVLTSGFCHCRTRGRPENILSVNSTPPTTMTTGGTSPVAGHRSLP